MRCPRCDEVLLLEHTIMNGEEITIVSCQCGYMRIKDGHI